jgi:hypothetical protein
MNKEKIEAEVFLTRPVGVESLGRWQFKELPRTGEFIEIKYDDDRTLYYVARVTHRLRRISNRMIKDIFNDAFVEIIVQENAGTK